LVILKKYSAFALTWLLKELLEKSGGSCCEPADGVSIPLLESIFTFWRNEAF
jgi:hypothetical protein